MRTDIETEKVVAAFFKERGGDLASVIAGLHHELIERITQLEARVVELERKRR